MAQASVTTVYRIQDAEGRGPWRPGFSKFWVRGRADLANLRPWMEEFKELRVLPRGEHYYGCACRTPEQLRRWFTRDEYATLRNYDFRAVSMQADYILAESTTQLVFMRALPLRIGAASVDLYGLDPMRG